MPAIRLSAVAKALGVSVRTVQRDLISGAIIPAYWATGPSGRKIPRFTGVWLEGITTCRVRNKRYLGSKNVPKASTTRTGTTQPPRGQSASRFVLDETTKRRIVSQLLSRRAKKSESQPAWME